MNQKVIIICASIYHGNTRKIAEAFGQEMACKVVTAVQAKNMDLSQYQVVGLGSGIYFTSHHPDILEIAGRLTKEQRVIIFSTRGCPFLGKYHQPLKQLLVKKGIEVVGEFSCKGYDCTGPYNLVNGGNKGKPNESDIIKAKKKIRKWLPDDCRKNSVPEEKHVWIDRVSCKNCKACVHNCPMKVFTIDEGKILITGEENCVHCSKCQEVCPEGCISIWHSKKELIQIAKTHAKRTSL